MTILQLKYVLAIAGSSSMREAASKLFVSQPALSTTIHELEEELGIKIFKRNNKGISLSEQGSEFLAYAKQAVSQYELIEDRYIEKDKNKKHFSVSMQHYVFAVHAFVNTVKKFDSERFVYSIHETRTDEVLTNVKNLKKDHPLAEKGEISLEDLKEYPCVCFDQSSDNDFYLSEEALGDYEFEKLIKSNDRATSSEIMAKLNGYSIGTGIMTDSITLQDGFVTIKLKEEDPLTIGYITRKNHKLSDIGEMYIEELRKYQEKELI